MSQNAKLTTFDRTGKTLREREVPFWYVRDPGEDDDEDGLYISLSTTTDRDTGVGVSIRAADLAEAGYYQVDLLDEETLLGLGYVKVF